MRPFHEKAWTCALIVTFIVFFHTFSFAQTESIKGIQFKDGSIIYGKVIKINVYDIQIETKDGKIISRKVDDVVIFIKDTSVDAKQEVKQLPVAEKILQTENIRGVRFKDGSVIYGTIWQMNVNEVTILIKNNKMITKKADDVASFIKSDERESTDILSKASWKTEPEISYEKSNYVVLKGGIYTPVSNDLKGLGFGTGYYGEVGLGHYFNQYFATEFGVGYYQLSSSASEPISSDFFTGSGSGSVKLDIWVIPVTFALKAIYPVNKFELYALGGVGAYYVNAKIDYSYSGSSSSGGRTWSGSGSANSNAMPLGAFLGGGSNLNFDQNWYIGVEGKYLWIKPSFNFGGTDVSVSADGWIVTGNVGYKF